MRYWFPLALAASLASAGCIDKKTAQAAVEAIQSGPEKPDVLPQIRSAQLPFRYPRDLYDRKVQGNVTLRIYIDSAGRVHPESTMVVQPSGYAALDSAAVAGVPLVDFAPATLRGQPIPVTILFPVYFRHPEATPLPGDTILKKRGVGSGE
jgi:TonB family protein